MAVAATDVVGLDWLKSTLRIGGGTARERAEYDVEDALLVRLIGSGVGAVSRLTGRPLVNEVEVFEARAPRGTDPLVLDVWHTLSVDMFRYRTTDNHSGPYDGFLDVSTLGGFEVTGAGTVIYAPQGGWPDFMYGSYVAVSLSRGIEFPSLPSTRTAANAAEYDEAVSDPRHILREAVVDIAAQLYDGDEVDYSRVRSLLVKWRVRYGPGPAGVVSLPETPLVPPVTGHPEFLYWLGSSESTTIPHAVRDIPYAEPQRFTVPDFDGNSYLYFATPASGGRVSDVRVEGFGQLGAFTGPSNTDRGGTAYRLWRTNGPIYGPVASGNRLEVVR